MPRRSSKRCFRITRRVLLSALGVSAIARPFALFAQPQPKVWKVGFFYFGSRQSAIDTGRYPEFLKGMRDLGYEEGRNLVIEARFADGKAERLPDISGEFQRLNVDVIVATGSPVCAALQRSGVTIPVAIT